MVGPVARSKTQRHYASALGKRTGEIVGWRSSPQTVNRYLQFLRRVLSKAFRGGKLANNPVSRIKMFKEPPGRLRFLSPEEEHTLCKAVGPECAPWVRLAILTGMRQAEQFSLRWEYVDIERGLITLPATRAGGVQYVKLNGEAKTILRELGTPGQRRRKP